MSDRIEILVANGRQHLDPHTFIIASLVIDYIGPAENRHLMASLYQPRCHLFNKGFKAAIICRDTTDPIMAIFITT